MLHASTQQLIRKLCELTEQGAIAWREGEGGSYIFETEGYLVEIRGEPPGVRLLQQDGRELERADAADLATQWPGGEGTYASNVAEMARHAGRTARGAETAIAKILSSLSSPPKKQAKAEPEPAALAFDPLPSHAMPEPAPVQPVSPETETAIDRVLAIQPAPQPEPVIVAAEAAEPEPVEAAAPEPQPEPEPEPASATPPVLIEPEPIEASAPPVIEAAPEPQIVEADPEPQLIETKAESLPEPDLAPEPAPAPTPIAAAKPGFGSIDSFTRARPAPRPPEPPQPDPTKVTSTGLLMRGFSARSHQTVDQSSVRDFFRPTTPEPQPRPVPAPAPQPAPEKQLETAAASGADIYKPWA